MSSRFETLNNIGFNKKSKRVYLTTIYPTVYNSPNDIIITSQETDRLDTLAYKFYKDSDLWWIIGKANGLGKGGLEIPPGTLLNIPSNPQYYLSLFKQINNL